VRLLLTISFEGWGSLSHNILVVFAGYLAIIQYNYMQFKIVWNIECLVDLNLRPLSRILKGNPFMILEFAVWEELHY
jgi:hypothetical protein